MSVPATFDEDMGEAMRALPSPLMRAYVIAMLDYPTGTKAVRAAAAGYAGTTATLQTRGSQLERDPRILAAMREEAVKRMDGASINSISVVLEIMNNPMTEPKTRLRAAEMVMNRIGMHERKETIVTKRKSESADQKIERVVRIATKLGLDPNALLASYGITVAENHSPALKNDPDEIVVDAADVTEVTPEFQQIEPEAAKSVETEDWSAL